MSAQHPERATIPKDVPSYQSRNSRRRWSSENYRYYVGQSVLWQEGTREGVPYGVWGVVTELPSDGQPYIIVKLRDREEPVMFDGGSELIPRRVVLRDVADLRRKQYKAAMDSLKRLDYLGNDV